MSASPDSNKERVPFMQQLFDNSFLLLILGLAVVAAFYTGWGLVEILTLPPATLP